MTVFRISPQLFFFIGLGLIVCLNAALYIAKSSGGIKISMKHEINKWIFSVYLLIIAALTLFPVQYTVTTYDPVFTPSRVNLVPFSAISKTFGVLDVAEFSFFFKVKAIAQNIGGGLILLMPFGFLLPQLRKKFHSPAICFALALAVSCAIETIRYVENSFGLAFNRTADIDDVILNAAGALIGFYCWRALRKKYCGDYSDFKKESEE